MEDDLLDLILPQHLNRQSSFHQRRANLKALFAHLKETYWFDNDDYARIHID